MKNESPTLKNYTSTVAAQISQSKIETKLREAGAMEITRTYETNICKSIRYVLPIDGKPITFVVEANVKACYNVLIKDRTYKPNEKQTQTLMEQAERTAWKIISDWIEIQISMILMEQAKPLQLMLAFLWNESKQETFYTHLRGTNFKALLEAGSNQ